ncbi:MAG: hypothetical protein HFG41_13670 [Coprococcus sp.]|nr:hypothetical protein [Coprococcus sp.]
MKKKLCSLALALSMTLSLAACGGNGGDPGANSANVPTIDELNFDDYKDLKAEIRVLTDSSRNF